MTKYIIKWIATSLAVFMVPYLVSGVQVKGFGTALCVSLVLGLLNMLVRPILFFITLPITIVTLGLFTLVLNALMIQLSAHFVTGFSVNGFAAAFWSSLLISFISWVLQLSFRRDGRPSIRVEGISEGRRFRDLNPQSR